MKKRYVVVLSALILSACSKDKAEIEKPVFKSDFELTVQQTLVVKNYSPAVLDGAFAQIAIPSNMDNLRTVTVVGDKKNTQLEINSDGNDFLIVQLDQLPPRSDQEVVVTYQLNHNGFSDENIKYVSLEKIEDAAVALEQEKSIDIQKKVEKEVNGNGPEAITGVTDLYQYEVDVEKETLPFESIILDAEKKVNAGETAYLFYGFKCPESGSCDLKNPVVWSESISTKSKKLVVRNFKTVQEAKEFLQGPGQYIISNASVSLK